MRTDLLTKKLDETSGRLSADSSLKDLEEQAAEHQPSFYAGSMLGSDRGRHEAGLGRGEAEVANDVLRTGEGQGNFIKKLDPPVMHGGKPAKVWQLLTNKKVRNGSSVAAVLVLLFGGGGLLSTLLAPSAAILQLQEVFTQSLNDQLKTIDTRSAKIMKAKFKSTTTGSCGAVVIKCQFANMSEAQAKEFMSRDKRFKIDLTDVKDGEGKIRSITFTEDGKKPVIAASGREFGSLLTSNGAFRTGWGNVYSAPFESTSDPKAREVIRDKAKASKNYALTGKDDEEKRKNLNTIAATGGNLDTKNLTKKTDKDGNTVYEDESGKTWTQAEYDDAIKRGEQMSDIVKAGGQNSIIGNASKVLAADNVAENLCTGWNSLRAVSAAAKLVKKQQAIRVALALVLTQAGKIRAGDAKEDEVNFAGNTIMATLPDKNVLDDSKLKSASSGVIPETKDPEAGGTGLDAPTYKIAAYGDTPKLSTRAEKFSLSAGSIAIVDAVTTGVARVVNGGNPNPKEVSKKCGYIQNNFVRVGALGLGILMGAATFGTWQIAGTVASVALSIAQPYLLAAAGDLLAGNVFKDLSGMDAVDATYVGTAGLLGDVAEARGMLPVTGNEGIQYINGNTKTLNAYIEDQRSLARDTPFDLSNRYSFFGSIVFANTPMLLSSSKNIATAMMNVASILPATMARADQTVGAATVQNEYFENYCNDPMYKAMGIKAGPLCVVRHYMPEDSLAIDPLENAQWMADSKNIDPASATGAAVDNGEDWNYIKYQAECSNRTQGWGENQDENSGDGSNCFDAKNAEANMHFRAYAADTSVNEGMRAGNTNTSPLKNSGAVDETNKSTPGPNGWALPVNNDQTIVQKFEDNHKGVDFAAGSVARTNLQPIYAVRDGTVVSAGRQKEYGNWVVINHGIIDGKPLYSVYGNIDDDQTLVKVGQAVKAGDMIAKIGSSRESGGPRLHFELWQGEPLAGGTPIDPTAMLEGARTRPGTNTGSV